MMPIIKWHNREKGWSIDYFGSIEFNYSEYYIVSLRNNRAYVNSMENTVTAGDVTSRMMNLGTESAFFLGGS